MHALIEELKQYHRDKAKLLLELERAVDYLAIEDGSRATVTNIRELFKPFSDPSEAVHHHNEELILLELRQTSAPIHRCVERIAGDHEAFDRMTTQIAAKIEDDSVSHGELAASIKWYVTTYGDHANGEENIFFPIADEYLQYQHWKKVKGQWQ